MAKEESWKQYIVYDSVPMFVAWFVSHHGYDVGNLYYILEKPWKYEELFKEYEEYNEENDRLWLEEEEEKRRKAVIKAGKDPESESSKRYIERLGIL